MPLASGRPRESYSRHLRGSETTSCVSKSTTTRSRPARIVINSRVIWLFDLRRKNGYIQHIRTTRTTRAARRRRHRRRSSTTGRRGRSRRRARGGRPKPRGRPSCARWPRRLTPRSTYRCARRPTTRRRRRRPSSSWADRSPDNRRGPRATPSSSSGRTRRWSTRRP